MNKTLMACTIGLMLSNTTVSAKVGDKLRSQTDASGKITISVFHRSSGNYQSHYTDFTVNVPDDYVAIGGGAVGARSGGSGHLLTASYPNDELNGWVVSSKDHVRQHKIKLDAYAIGIKMEGLSRAELKKYIAVNKDTSSAGSHPNISVGVESNHLLIGGGIRVNWEGAGNLATATYPENESSWVAESKDHMRVDRSEVDVWSIGIADYIPNIGDIEMEWNKTTSGSTSHPTTSVNVKEGYVLTGCGAFVDWSGSGNLLWKIKPNADDNDHGCEVGSKDHIRSSHATITGYALGIKANP